MYRNESEEIKNIRSPKLDSFTALASLNKMLLTTETESDK